MPAYLSSCLFQYQLRPGEKGCRTTNGTICVFWAFCGHSRQTSRCRILQKALMPTYLTGLNSPHASFWPNESRSVKLRENRPARSLRVRLVQGFQRGNRIFRLTRHRLQAYCPAITTTRHTDRLRGPKHSNRSVNQHDPSLFPATVQVVI